MIKGVLGWAGLVVVVLVVYVLCAGGSWLGVFLALVVIGLMYWGYRRGRNTNSQ